MLSLKVAAHSKPKRLTVSGELTIFTAAQARQEFPRHLADQEIQELDLSGVEELDTAGIQLLLWVKRRAAAEGRGLSFVHHSPAVMDVFDLLKLGGTFGDPILLDAQTP